MRQLLDSELPVHAACMHRQLRLALALCCLRAVYADPVPTAATTAHMLAHAARGRRMPDALHASRP
jgi:hypothetical protein